MIWGAAGGLWLTALWMGLIGGAHCVAMCGVACQGWVSAGGWPALWRFHGGRMIGYGLLGGGAAALMQGLGTLTVYSAALRPVWSGLHLAILALGLVLLVRGEQPRWIGRWASRLWQRLQRSPRLRGPRAWPLLAGMAWALLPCGLLVSAVMLAVLAGTFLGGMATMWAFAAGTAVALSLWPWAWRLLGSRGPQGPLGVRLAGLMLMASAAWALWLAWAHDQAPWCVTPG